MKISTINEYGALKSVIVGSVENMAWPKDDKEFNAGIDRSTYPSTLTRGAIPKRIQLEASEDLERLVQILENYVIMEVLLIMVQNMVKNVLMVI